MVLDGLPVRFQEVADDQDAQQAVGVWGQPQELLFPHSAMDVGCAAQLSRHQVPVNLLGQPLSAVVLQKQHP